MTSKSDKCDSARCLVEKPSVETRITFWDWSEDSRPELRLLSEKEALIAVGGQDSVEIIAEHRKELICLLEGWRDIIQEGINLLNTQEPLPDDKAESGREDG